MVERGSMKRHAKMLWFFERFPVHECRRCLGSTRLRVRVRTRGTNAGLFAGALQPMELTTRRSLSEATRPDRDAWTMWERSWHAAWFLILSVSTAVALAGPHELQHRFGITAGALALATSYILAAMWRPELHRQPRAMLPPLIPGLLVAQFLNYEDPAFLWVSTLQLAVLYRLLPIPWSVPAALLSSAATLWFGTRYYGPAVAIFGLFAVAASTFLAMYITSIVRQSRERKSLLDQLGSAQKSLAEAERAAGVLEERQRIAREIHDTVTQELIVIVQSLEAHLRRVQGAKRDVDRSRSLESALRAARRGVKESRRLVWSSSAQAPGPSALRSSLERVVNRFISDTGIAATLVVENDDPNGEAIGSQIELVRGVQEALVNARKHASPRSVTVTLSTLADFVVVDVHDDGRGFSTQDANLGNDAVCANADGGGFGLRSLKNRVTKLGGELIVESSIGCGTTVGIRVPRDATKSVS
jgi:signal transduction histidine kinase